MAQCMFPFSMKDKMTGDTMSFPCGKCPHCLKRRASGWSFRLLQHAKFQNSALFVTLTYNFENVPISDHGFMTLCKRDVQLFFKRLRKQFPKSAAKITYYAVGEYGTKRMRPHYHLLLFNATHESVEKAWMSDGRSMGTIHYGDVTGASVGYCLKYMMKPSRVPKHKNDDRLREFQLCSRGIGLQYLTPQMVDWFKADLLNRYYLPHEGGKKIAMPRYYKNKIYCDSERRLIGVAMRLTAESREMEDERKLQVIIGKQDMEHYKLERDKAAIAKMHKDSLIGRNLE